ncbi:MAG: hypothetical protein ACXIUQ_01615 [Cecembia sp.]
MVRFLLLLLCMVSCISKNEIHQMNHPQNIYLEEESILYLPFKFEIDPMQRLLLVNFENDPDEEFIGLEPQYFDDEANGRGLLVIAWRKDMRVEVYHEAGLQPDPNKYDIAGNGLASMHQVDFDQNEFEINGAGALVKIEFRDKNNRKIRIHIEENHPKKRAPFGLLAPMGDAASNPSAMPLVLLHDFYFVRRKHTQLEVSIDGRKHQADKLPLPLDGTWMYFARYSPDPFIVTFNPATSEALKPVRLDNRHLTWDYNGKAREIKSLIAEGDGHQVSLSFDPAFPQFNMIKPGLEVKGSFVIAGEKSTGIIQGTYTVSTKGEGVQILLHPNGGWIPNEKKISLRLLYAMAGIFRNWPKTYLWTATLHQEENHWRLISSWERLKK